MSFVAGSREPMLDLRQASGRTVLPVKTLRRAISRGHLRARQPRGQRKLYVLIEDLDAWATAEPAEAPRRERRARAATVKPLRPRDREPGSLARLNELEERSAVR